MAVFDFGFRPTRGRHIRPVLLTFALGDFSEAANQSEPATFPSELANLLCRATNFMTKNIAMANRIGPPPPTIFNKKNMYKATKMHASFKSPKKSLTVLNIS